VEKNFKKIGSSLLLLLFLIILGLYLRYLNLFFEDYWIDEMVSFWNADPNISLPETLDRVLGPGGTPALFSILLKYFFKFFQYDPNVGKFLNLILGVAAIPFGFLISKELKIKESSVLFSFFICTNIYLINYSQEVRPYTLLVLISFLNIFLFLKAINEYKNKNLFYILCSSVFIINILGFSTHPYFLIIIVSEISYCLIQIILKKKQFIKIFLILTFSLIFSFLIQYDYILSLSDQEAFYSWGGDYLNVKFLYEFYFPRFFGSKIMGAIYMIALISLIIYFRRKIFFSSHYFIFVLIIFFSYFIPILYGFIRMPALTDRYIIFVLIPIFALISALIYELKSTSIKRLIIFILLTTTLSNLYLEITDKAGNKGGIYPIKPETKKLLNSISALHDEQYSKNIYIDKKNGVPTFFNYVVNLDEFSNNDLKMLKLNELSSTDNFWLICYVDIYVNGVWYKDLPDESNSSCPRLETGISKKFKIIKIIKKNDPFHKVIAKYYVK